MATVSPTQSNVQAALRSFLIAVLPAYAADGSPFDVVVAVQNRVPEPAGTSFVVLSPLRIARLGTNLDETADCRFTGSIAPASAGFTATIAPATTPGPAVLTASAVTGTIVLGAALSGTGIALGTTIGAQLSGTPGGAGTYAVTPIQTVSTPEAATASYGVLTAAFGAGSIGTITQGAQVFGVGVAAGTTITAFGSGAGGAGTYYVAPSQSVSDKVLAAGQESLTIDAEWVVQCDFHSADNSASDMAQTVSALLRDDYGVSFFAGLAAPLNGVVPLYADDPRYVPFINESNAYEWRWILDVHLEVDQTVVVPTQFADSLTVQLESVDIAFPP